MVENQDKVGKNVVWVVNSISIDEGLGIHTIEVSLVSPVLDERGGCSMVNSTKNKNWYEVNGGENIGDRCLEEKSGGLVLFGLYCSVVSQENKVQENRTSSIDADVTTERCYNSGLQRAPCRLDVHAAGSIQDPKYNKSDIRDIQMWKNFLK